MRWWLVLLVACSGGGTIPDATEDPQPVADIGVVPGARLTSGSWLLVNDWAPSPNALLALRTDDLGGNPLTVFTAPRVWSFGAPEDGSSVLFASWDAAQEQHFGLTLGDSIQNTFVYGTTSQHTVYLGLPGTMWQNVNDECQAPSVDGRSVYVCRRYDFTNAGTFSGWRIGRIDLQTRAFEFLRADDPNGPFELNAQELADGKRILFELRARPPASGVSIHLRDLMTGSETMLWTNASRPVLGPDGDRVVYADTTAQYRLRERRISRPEDPAITVSDTAGIGRATWSLDGTTIVYTVYDQPKNCDHLERVTWNGSAWSSPERVRDCTTTGEFLTDAQWIEVP